MRALVRQANIADFLDVNIPVGKLYAQIQLIKRLLASAGVSDMLDVDLNKASLARAAAEANSLSATIPVNFDVSDLPVVAPLAPLTEKVNADTGEATAAIAALQARMAALSGTLTDLRVGLDDTGAVAKIAALQAKLAAIAKFTDSIALVASTSKLDVAIAAEQAKLAALQATAADIDIYFNTADLAKLDAQIATLQAKIAAMQAQADAIRLAFTVDDAGLAKADAQLLALEALTQRMAATVIPLKFDITGLPVGGETVDLNAKVSLTGAINGLKQMADAANTDTAVLGSLNPRLIQTSLYSAALAKSLGGSANAMAVVTNDTTRMAAAVQAGRDAIAGLSLSGDKGVTVLNTMAAAQGFADLSVMKFATAALTAKTDVDILTLGVKATAVTVIGATAGWGALLTKLTLFGGLVPGIAGHVQVFHVLADLLIEFAAVAVPAVVGVLTLVAALGIFVLVGQQAGDTFSHIYDRMMYLFYASQALGVSIPPLQGTFASLASAMRPEIFTLLGEAMNQVSGQTGMFGRVAQATGAILDRFGADLAHWFDTTDFSHFIKISVADLLQFGKMFQNLGDALTHFFEAAEITHIAEDFLEFFVILSDGIKWLSKLPPWLIAATLALHGVWLWGGLVSTMLLKLIDPVRSLALAMGGLDVASSSLASLPEDASAWQKISAALSDAGAGFGSIIPRMTGAAVSLKQVSSMTGMATTDLSALQASAAKTGQSIESMVSGPAVGDVATFSEGLNKSQISMLNLAAAGGATQGQLGKLAAGMGSTSDEAMISSSAMGDLAMDTAGAGAAATGLSGMLSSLGAALASPVTWALALAAALVVVSVEVIRAQDATQLWIQGMNSSIDKASPFAAIAATVSDLAGVTQQLANVQQGAAGNAGELSAAQNDLSGKLGNELTHVSEISKAYGTDFVGALSLLNAAQVTTGQLASSNNKTWAEAKIQVAGLVTGYKDMAVGIGAAENAVTVQMVVGGESVLSAMGKLNTAWDSFTTIVSAPVSGVLTVASSFNTFATDAKAAGASMTGVAGIVAKESSKMSSSSIQLQQDFQSTFGDVEQLFDSFRNTQAVTGGGNFTAFAQDAVAALIPLAGSNKAAAAEISVLAQEAGGPATTNLASLAKWAGNVKDPLDALYNAAESASVNVSNLNVDAQALSQTLEGDLNPAMADAAFNALGGQKNFATFADDLQKFGPGSQATVTAAKAVANELLAIDKNSVSAQAQFVGMMESMGYSAAQADALWKKAYSTSSMAIKIKFQDNIAIEKKSISSLQKQISETTDPAKKHVLEMELKVDTSKLGKLESSLKTAEAPADKIRDSLAKTATAGTDLADSGFWGQVRDKIIGLADDVRKHPIAFLLLGPANFIPGVTKALDAVGKAVSNFFTKTLPGLANGAGSALSGAWSTVYQGFMTGFGSPLTAWFTVSFPHAMEAAWDKTWSGLVTPVTHAFGDVKKAIVTGFDGWWKTHGKEVEEAWNFVTSNLTLAWHNFTGGLIRDWNAVSPALLSAVKAVWSHIASFFSSGSDHVVALVKSFWKQVATTAEEFWGLLVPVMKIGWAVLTGIFRVAASVIEGIVKVLWDTLAAIAKIFWAATVASFKIGWDVIVAIFSVALDLITGHWSQAWSDIKTLGVQIWNAIKAFYVSGWNDLKTLFSQALGIIKSTWDSVWSDIKSATDQTWAALKTGFASAVSSIKNTWDSLEGIFKTPVNFLINTVYTQGIERLWNDVIAKLGGPAMPGVAGLAAGGIINMGSGPTSDDVLARVSRGETVVSAADSRKLAPAFAAVGVPGYAAGGIPGGGVVKKIAGAVAGAAGDIGSFVKSTLGKIDSAGKVAAALASGNETALVNALTSLLGGTGLGGAQGILAQMMTAAPGHLITEAVKDVWARLLSKVKGSAAKAAAVPGIGGSASPGLMTVAEYIIAHGGTKAAGAGVAGVVAGESSGDPEVHESGGGGGEGLLQWTPPTVPWPYPDIITGNVGKDMATQLADMMGYISQRGGIGEINAGGESGGPMGAAEVFSRMEAPAVPGSDIRAGSVAAIYAALGGGGGTAAATARIASAAGDQLRAAKGGLIPGFAAGGAVPAGFPQEAAVVARQNAATAALRSKVAAALAAEQYYASGLDTAFTRGPPEYRTPGVMKELKALGAEQSAEHYYYRALAGTGLTGAGMARLGTEAGYARKTAGAGVLSRLPGGHPWWARGLEAAAAALGTAAKTAVPVLGTAEPAATTALRALLAREQASEQYYASGLDTAFTRGPAKYRTAGTMRDLKTLASEQASMQADYRALAGAGLTVANMTALHTEAGYLKQAAGEDKDLSRLPGGHPWWAGQLAATAASVAATTKITIPAGMSALAGQFEQYLLSGGKGSFVVSEPGLQEITYAGSSGIGKYGPSAMAAGGKVLSYDQGGMLPTGLSLAYNGTSQPEAVGGGGSQKISITVSYDGSMQNTGLSPQQLAALRFTVRTKGGGSVQKALGNPHMTS